MDTLGECRLMYYSPHFNVTNYDSGVIRDSHVHTDSIVPRKLRNRVVDHDGENKNGAPIMNLDNGKRNFPLSEPLVIKVKDNPIPLTLNNHPQDNLTINKRVILNTGIISVNGTQVYVIFTIRRRGCTSNTFPPLRNALGTLTVRYLNPRLP